MAWLIVMAEDRAPYEQGDVVSIRGEDAPNFGTGVLTDAAFVIFHVADMSSERAECLCAPQSGDLILNAKLKPRSFYIDFKLLPGDKLSSISHSKIIEFLPGGIESAITIKEIVSDVIGLPGVIG